MQEFLDWTPHPPGPANAFFNSPTGSPPSAGFSRNPPRRSWLPSHPSRTPPRGGGVPGAAAGGAAGGSGAPGLAGAVAAPAGDGGAVQAQHGGGPPPRSAAGRRGGRGGALWPLAVPEVGAECLFWGVVLLTLMPPRRSNNLV